eukprot:Selendium_serpulae@DN5530_c0_g1_i10.p1
MEFNPPVTEERPRSRVLVSYNLILSDDVKGVDSFRSFWNEPCVEIAFLKGNSWYTVLQAAMIGKKENIFNHLMENSTDVDMHALSQKGDTPVMVAAQAHVPVKWLRGILDNGGMHILNERDLSGKSALDYSSKDWEGHDILVACDALTSEDIDNLIKEEEDRLAASTKKKKKKKKKDKTDEGAALEKKTTSESPEAGGDSKAEGESPSAEFDVPVSSDSLERTAKLAEEKERKKNLADAAAELVKQKTLKPIEAPDETLDEPKSDTPPAEQTDEVPADVVVETVVERAAEPEEEIAPFGGTGETGGSGDQKDPKDMNPEELEAYMRSEAEKAEAEAALKKAALEELLQRSKSDKIEKMDKSIKTEEKPKEEKVEEAVAKVEQELGFWERCCCSCCCGRSGKDNVVTGPVTKKPTAVGKLTDTASDVGSSVSSSTEAPLTSTPET